MKNKMVIVGVASPRYERYKTQLRLYYLEKKAIKDVSDEDLAPHVEKLGVMNFEDLQIPAVRALYPHYLQDTSGLYSGSDACYVLGSFGSGGYVCIRPHLANDYVQVIPRSRLVSDVKSGKLYLLNAVIEQGSVSDTVTPIKGGEWEDMSHLKGRSLVDKADEGSCGCEGEDCDCATSSKDSRDNIGAGESVDAHDELGMLSDAQKDFLKTYYIDYSIETFNKLVGKSQWRLKEDHEIVEKNKKRRESKLAKLAELRTLSGGANWRFAGAWDVGRVTGKPEHMCEFGHKLRHIYMACPAGKKTSEAESDGTLLKFGIKCHADFLSIPAEEVARLGKLLSTMSSETAFISTVVANGALAKHDKIMASMHDLLGRLQSNGRLEVVLGSRLAQAYAGFKSNGLPLLETFVLDVLDKFKEYGYVKVLSEAGVDVSLFASKPTEVYSLTYLGSDADARLKRDYSSKLSFEHNNGLAKLSRAYDPFQTVLATYAEKLMSNDIAGEFMYNPASTLTDYVKGKSSTYQRYGADEVVPNYPDAMRKYVVGYNSDTRDARKVWMQYFRQNTFIDSSITAIGGYSVSALTLDALEQTIELYKRLIRTGKNIKGALGTEFTYKLIETLLEERLARYSRTASKFSAVYPELLLTALPYVVTDVNNVQARRAAHYISSRVDKAKIESCIEATKEGKDPKYLIDLKATIVVEVPETKPESVVEVKAEPVVEVKAEAGSYVTPALNTSKPDKPVNKSGKASSKDSSKSGTKAGARRGSASDAKKMADEFDALFAKAPKSSAGDSGVQIAQDIIKRFRGVFKEREGFTSREEWRVNHEIESLKRLIANK